MVKLSQIKGQKRIVLCDLVQNGVSTASQISKRTRLSKNKVYEFLSELRKEKMVTRPPILRGETLYTFDRDVVLKCLHDENRKLNGLARELHEIEEKITSSQEKAIIQLSDEIWTGPPEQALLQTVQLIKEARRSILISSYMFGWFTNVKKHLNRTLNKGVAVKVLMTDPSSPIVFSEDHRRELESRVLSLKESDLGVSLTKERVPFRGSIFDEKAVLIMMFPYSNSKDSNICTGFCVCTNSAIVQTLVHFFHISIQQPTVKTESDAITPPRQE